MNMCTYKISSRYLQKWLRYSIKHVKNMHFFHVISGLYRDFPNFCFLTDFDASKSALGSIFRVLCENLT